MKREKNTQRTFWDDIFLGVLIGTIAYSIVATFILFYLCDEVEYLSDANHDKIVVLSQKNEKIREQEKMIVELEKQLSELPKWTYESDGIYKLTFYWAKEDSVWGDMTSTGVRAKQGVTCAADPNILPYNTEIMIPELDNYVCKIQDTGSALKGKKVIDIYVDEPRMERHYKEVFIKKMED